MTIIDKGFMKLVFVIVRISKKAQMASIAFRYRSQAGCVQPKWIIFSVNFICGSVLTEFIEATATLKGTVSLFHFMK